MPIYDYRCGECGEVFEALVRSRERPACPSCSSTALERQPSAPTVHSAGTRANARGAAKRRDQAQGRDRMHERIEYAKSHDDH